MPPPPANMLAQILLATGPTVSWQSRSPVPVLPIKALLAFLCLSCRSTGSVRERKTDFRLLLDPFSLSPPSGEAWCIGDKSCLTAQGKVVKWGGGG